MDPNNYIYMRLKYFATYKNSGMFKSPTKNFILLYISVAMSARKALSLDFEKVKAQNSVCISKYCRFQVKSDI